MVYLDESLVMYYVHGVPGLRIESTYSMIQMTALWEHTMVKILISVMILDANLYSHNKVRLIAESRSLAI